MAILLSHRDRHPFEDAVTFYSRNYWPEVEERFDPRPADDGDEHATAVVNHGRWIVRCPFCTGAQLADPEDHRFFCNDCLNHPVEGRVLVVDWPNPVVQPAIEQALLDRPVASTRNWETWEEVSWLLAENVIQGVGTDYSIKGGSDLDRTGSLPIPVVEDQGLPTNGI
jgi:hypothetical protein